MKATRLMMTALVVAALAGHAAAQRTRPERPERPERPGGAGGRRGGESVIAGLKALAADNDRVTSHVLIAKPRGMYMRFAVSSDLRHYAYIGPNERGDPGQLVIDGVEKGDKRVYPGELLFLGGTAIAGVSSGRTQGPFVVNGELWPGTGVHSEWTVSPDGKRIAHVIRKRGGPPTLVLDGKIVAKSLAITNVTFSPDSKRLACRLSTPTRKDSPWANREIPRDQWLWVDGNRTGPFEYVGEIQFSPDSKRVACRARTVIQGKTRNLVLLDGKTIAMGKSCGITGFDAEGRLVFTWWTRRPPASTYIMDARNRLTEHPGGAILSPDGKHIAWLVGMPGSQRIVVNGKPQPAYGAIKHIRVAPVTGKVAYVASNDGKTHQAVVDGKVVATSKGFRRPIFSPNGRRVAFIAQPEGPNEPYKRELIIDGKGYPAAEFMSEPKVRFSADGKHWMAVAARVARGWDRQCDVLWDGKSIGRFQRVKSRGLRMTHDGKCVFLGCKSRTSMAVYVGDKPGPTYEMVRALTVSDDGRHVAYAAKDADGDYFVVLDGEAFAVPTPAMPTQMAFIDADTLRAFCPTYQGYALLDFKVQGIP